MDIRQPLMGLLGQGMAKQAGQNLQMHPAYQSYAIDMQSSGMQPLPYQQWLRQMQQMQSMQQMQMPEGLLSQ